MCFVCVYNKFFTVHVHILFTQPKASYKNYIAIFVLYIRIFNMHHIQNDSLLHICIHIQVIELLPTGYCQPPPPGCPKKIYRIMVQCW